MTRLQAERDVAGAVEMLTADPERWLPPPCRPAGPNRWLVTLHAGPFRRSTLMEVGPLWDDGTRIGRPVRWQANPEPGDVLPFEFLLPTFEGELVAAPGRLTIQGTYEPPAGMVGRMADVVLSRAARRTLRRLLADLARQAVNMTTRG